MAITIKYAIIHGFDKVQHTQEITSLIKKDVNLDTEQIPVIGLVEGIAKLLGRRKNAQSWGRFDDATRAGPVPPSLKLHYTPSETPGSFISMTHCVMDEISNLAKKTPLSTGSHIIFSQFTEDSGPERLLIAMIKQKGGIQLDENFIPIGIQEVDMSKLSQAADIRLLSFIDNSKDEQDSVDEEENEAVNYLSFLSQRDSDEASSYFIKALGCIVGISPKKATASIFLALDSFITSKSSLHAYRRAAKEKLCEYLTKQNSTDSAATLVEVAYVIRSIIPADLADQTSDIESYLNGEDFKIPAEFFVHREALRKHSKVNLETEEMQLKFNRSIIGKTSNSKVFYDKDARKLIISGLSDKIVQKLDKDLSE
jgi:nucleoid-associated protein